MKGLKRLGKIVSPFVLTAMLLPAVAGIARAQPKEQEKKQSKLEFEIGPSVTFPFSNYAKDYCSQLNKDFKTGKYTWDIPLPQWKDIKAPSSIDFGVEGSCLVGLKSGKIKNPRVGVVAGYRISSPSSEYNETYKDVYDPFTKEFGDFKFNREEDVSINTISFGPKVKMSLTDNLDFSTTLTADLIKAKSEVNYTRKTMFPWYSKEHIEWRKADCSGSGTGFSVEAGIDYKITDNILIGVGLGYRGGKVKTKGKEVESWPDTTYTRTKDYGPEFNFNSTYGKVGVEVKF